MGARRVPGFPAVEVKRSRWAQGSQSRCPKHPTSPMRNRSPTRALRPMPRVTTLRRASSGLSRPPGTLSSSSTSSSMSVRSWPRLWAFENVRCARIAVAFEAAAGASTSGGDVVEFRLGVGRVNDRFHGALPARGRLLRRRREGHVGGGDDVTGVDGVEGLGACERVPGESRAASRTPPRRHARRRSAARSSGSQGPAQWKSVGFAIGTSPSPRWASQLRQMVHGSGCCSSGTGT
jgi:hypothetical protein